MVNLLELKSLNKNWFIDGWIDFEYKKYELLAYLQKVDQLFNQTKLYPYFSDLINHYSYVNEYMKNESDFKSNFNKNIKSIDLKNLQLNYKSNFKKHYIIEEMLNIIHFAQKELKTRRNEPKYIREIAEFISSHKGIKIESLASMTKINSEKLFRRLLD